MKNLVFVAIVIALVILAILYRLYYKARKREQAEYQDPLDLRPIWVDPIQEKNQEDED